MSESVTIAAALLRAVPILTAAGVDTPRLDAQLLLAWVLKMRREDLAREPERIVPERERLIFEKAIELRAQRRPLPYITGEAWFYGRSFKINRAVLIPRPETELLVDFVVGALAQRKAGSEPIRMADVGTGSGCIAVSIAAEIPEARVVATDISRLALLVADKNRRRYKLQDRIELREGDLCAPLAPGELFDVIVSNPPYIPISDAPGLMPEVRDYEPALALYGAELTASAAADLPQTIRRRLLTEAREHLAPGGIVAIEMGIGQAEQAVIDAKENGYENIELIRDQAGIERILTATHR